mmetsp:Transcript_5817/g.11084  ORF Transcript_5817/g.11084 Transcript_5817/m.11084 type:complete len:83 (-) Transcript_5817:707-955(-)
MEPTTGPVEVLCHQLRTGHFWKAVLSENFEALVSALAVFEDLIAGIAVYVGDSAARILVGQRLGPGLSNDPPQRYTEKNRTG